MKRAVIKDRRGDVISDVRYFHHDDDFARYVDEKRDDLARYGQRVEELPATTLNEAQVGDLELLRKLAMQAFGILRPFVMDRDASRRWANRKPTAKDVAALAECLRQAAAEFEVLVPLDYQVQK